MPVRLMLLILFQSAKLISLINFGLSIILWLLVGLDCPAEFSAIRTGYPPATRSDQEYALPFDR